MKMCRYCELHSAGEGSGFCSESCAEASWAFEKLEEVSHFIALLDWRGETETAAELRRTLAWTDAGREFSAPTRKVGPRFPVFIQFERAFEGPETHCPVLGDYHAICPHSESFDCEFDRLSGRCVGYDDYGDAFCYLIHAAGENDTMTKCRLCGPPQ